METDPTSAALFVHIRIFIGMVTGLAVTRLLAGCARFIQHPGRERIYPVQLGWAAFLVLAIMHFWWFEFGLSHMRWSFDLYFFVTCYAGLFFLSAVVLFPDTIHDYEGWSDYFHSRRRWFYGLLTLIFALDLVDTALKGEAHFRALGPDYPWRQGGLLALTLTAALFSRRSWHGVVVALALTAQLVWLFGRFGVLDWYAKIP